MNGLPTVDPIALGATLYVPATRDDLGEVASGHRHPTLRSAVLCLEDSVREDELPFALRRLATMLAALRPREEQPSRPLLFVRPRDAAMLGEIAAMAGIEQVDGFVIPKATADTMPRYLAALGHHDHHLLMPTLETREVFDQAEMRRLREQLLAIPERVLAIRIGGNDLLQTVGARRSPVRTAYDGPLGSTIVSLVATFAPWGFALSAPVFEGFGNTALLREELERDIEHGLLTKTAIHPAQIGPIHEAYQVTTDELVEATAMLSRDSRAVFASQATMCEPATHGRWASTILRRADCFGLRHAIEVPRTA
ncbi:citrate lyase beta subunit [Sphingomonas zeicaulis]|uniref:HpcH/HpaI aldolase/citrate lyase family protein n=1 Tax=Sphingomonas zeicaulis TaxID=1632740 RepID=UPI003D1AD3D6